MSIDISDQIAATKDVPAPVMKWLFDVVQPIYNDPRTVFHDSLVILSQFKEIRPRTRVYTSSKGIPQLLLCLYGKFDIYNNKIPILLWIPKNYPYEHPLLYIDLELLSEYKVSMGRYVDSNGAVHLPIFDRWDSQQCNIFRVIKEFLSESSEHIPIEPLKVESQVNFDAKSNMGAPIRLPPKLPRELIAKDVSVDSSGFSQLSLNGKVSTAPTLPPKQAVIIPKNPQLPPKPVQPIIQHSAISTNVKPKSSKDLSTSSNEVPALPEKPPVPSTIDLLDVEINSKASTELHTNLLEELQTLINNLQGDDLRFIKENILVRKRGIENAIVQFRNMYEQEELKLSETKNAIENNMNKLSTELKYVEEQNKNLKDFEMKNGGNIDTSSILTTNSIALDQLYNLVAKDHAISDTMHSLSQLLNNGTITLNIFVKKTRELARTQFLTRALIQKIASHLNN
ncbi:hypothetical protein Kpol_487p3 [Vanderwaltozyma polyspora DSM 70294]|uniref:UEV domain-containing protein n=1 Tax=Vanderwaltozyma polyspora (strain ATCC 22028 / DSM 70294 / BCRC 21397 / CBS 2163 / NBRC 10782 / NRRL Y-8283 / UCD 57-17) TaxID=436907 RepID=A7TQ78_VANPO|nr:uncharacterized protein Kpol_487p3 [Vanderwaltozyma polyspora DSM 70294]EDO15570.1 hypothetical protein Kpol_487p3 [Vanderwaltozyma polyspora DSM 70294]